MCVRVLKINTIYLTYERRVAEPPKPPVLGVVNATWTDITVNWTKAPNTYAVQQYLLSYKYVNVSSDGDRSYRPVLPCLFVAQEPENVYTELSLPAHANAYTLSNVKCGTAVAFSISAINRVGHGTQSRPFNAKTLHGNTPIAPAQAEVSTPV